MNQGKYSPDEKITAIALSQPDPFARPGKQRFIPKTPNRPQRDFSHFDDPLEAKKPQAETVEATPEPPKEKKPKGRPKKLENLPEPPAKTTETAEIIFESRSQEGMPSYRTEFSGRDIFVGFPCYKNTNPVTAFAMIAMALDFGRDRIRFDMSIGDAMVYHSRNRLVEKFLQTDAKYLFMMDDDIIPCIGRPAWMRSCVVSARNIADLPLQRHILHRLVNSNKTLIGGAYFGRQENGKLMCSDQSLEKSARQYADSIVQVDWVGTGCMLIHRQVFQDIQKKFPELVSNHPEVPFDYFLPMKGHVGEDVAFCYRAEKAGHSAHIDLGTPVFHVGYKTY